MKNRFLLFTLLSLYFYSTTAQTPNWQWAKSTGGISSEEGNCVSVDVNENVYVTGTFMSSLIVIGSTTLLNSGGRDIFLAKYDSNGNVLWSKRAGGTDNDLSISLTTDTVGNLFLTGYFNSPAITFGTTTLTNTSAGNSDIFIVKYDPNGNVLWANHAGGTSYDLGYSVSTDANGNVFMTGSFASPTITFGAITLVNAGYENIFIVKYDASGNVLWAESAGGTSWDEGYEVSTDGSGNVFVAGYYTSQYITFGSTTLTNAGTGTSDIFIAKYDAIGNLLWAKSQGSAGYDDCYSVSTDFSGNAYITGTFSSSTITFGTNTLTNAGDDDIYIAKYDMNGNVLWAHSAGGISQDHGFNVSCDEVGNVFMTGWFFSSSISFGSTVLTSADSSDIFITKYDSNGNVMWARNAGGSGNEFGVSISNVRNENVYISGFFTSPTINFGTTILTNAGNWDMYIAKLSETTVGINEFSIRTGFSISPNPFHSETIITFNQEQTNTIITLTDLSGKEINKTCFSGKQFVIEKGTLQPGIYLLHTIDENKNSENRKIIIQ